MSASVISHSSGRSGHGRQTYDIKHVRRLADWSRPTQPLHLRIPDPRNIHAQVRAMSSVERLAESSAYGGDAESIYSALSDRCADSVRSHSGSPNSHKSSREQIRAKSGKARAAEQTIGRKNASRHDCHKKAVPPLPKSTSVSTFGSVDSLAPTPPLSREQSQDSTALTHSSSSQSHIRTPEHHPYREQCTGPNSQSMKHGSERDLFTKLYDQSHRQHYQSSPDSGRYEDIDPVIRRKVIAKTSHHDPDWFRSRCASAASSKSIARNTTSRPLPATPCRAQDQGDLSGALSYQKQQQSSSAPRIIHDCPDALEHRKVESRQVTGEWLEHEMPIASIRKEHTRIRIDEQQEQSPENLPSSAQNPLQPYAIKVFAHTAKDLQQMAHSISDVPSNATVDSMPLPNLKNSEASQRTYRSMDAESQDVFSAKLALSRPVQTPALLTRNQKELPPKTSVLERARPKIQKKVPNPTNESVEPLRIQKNGSMNTLYDTRAAYEIRIKELAAEKRAEAQAKEAKLRLEARMEMERAKKEQMRQVQQTHKLLLEGSWSPKALAKPQLPTLPTLISLSTIDGVETLPPSGSNHSLRTLDPAVASNNDDRQAQAEYQSGLLMNKTGIPSLDAHRFGLALAQIGQLTRTGAEKNLWVRQWAKAVDTAEKEVKPVHETRSETQSQETRYEALAFSSVSPLKLKLF